MVKNFRFKEAEIGVFLDASAAAALVVPGARVLGLTDGRFSLIDLIFHVLQNTGRANVALATWSAGIKDAHQVKWMVDNDLINEIRVLTDHSYRTRQARYAIALEELFGPENIRTSEMHAKYVLIWNETRKVCIRTSMNLNANKTCETFEIDDDVDIFDFYMGYVEHTFGTMPTGVEGSGWKARISMEAFFGKEEQKKKENTIIRKF